jgi:ribosomal protein L13
VAISQKILQKTSFEHSSKSNPSTTTVTSAMPSIEPTIYIDNDTESKIKQLLPEGTVEVSMLKSVYVYPSAEDEKREKELEKKYREGLEKNWNKFWKIHQLAICGVDESDLQSRSA